MEPILVTPHSGIGPLKLGMSPETVLEKLYQMRTALGLPDSKRIQVSKYPEAGLTCMRYIDDAFFFLIYYKDGRAVEIGIDNTLRAYTPIMLLGMDVFKTTVRDLTAALKALSDYDYDYGCVEPDERFATNYEFHQLGIRLWKDEPSEEACYFELVAVKAPE